MITSVPSKIKNLGVARYSACPYCATGPALHIIETFLAPKILYVSALKLRRDFFALCPICRTLLQITPQVGVKLSRDLTTLLLSKDLHLPSTKPLVSCGFSKKWQKPQ